MKTVAILSIVALLGLAGCGGSGSSNTTANTSTASSSNTNSSSAQSSETTRTKQATGEKQVSGNPSVVIKTSKGAITLMLEAEKAPKSVENFLTYVRDGFYEDTVFHRVIPGFMVQGGGMDADMNDKQTRGSIKNEANNGLKNVRGSVAMARTNMPHSASSQFFINVADNAALNHRSETPQGWGYAVFGEVTEGMDVVDEIVSVPTTSKKGHRDVPVEPIVIESVEIVD